MDDRHLESFIGRLAHGREPYRLRAPCARWLGTALASLLLLSLAAGPARGGARAREIKANGSWRRFEIKTPEDVLPYLFEVTAGCRYRLTVQCRTLRRVLLELGPGDQAIYTADSTPAPRRPGEPPVPRPDKPEAVIAWDAETDGVFEARVRGFSALTGRGRLKLETLGPDEQPVKAHRRMLAPGGTLARVGALWVGEPNRWELIVRPGRTYEVRSRPGTAGRLALAVIGPDDFVFASAGPDTWRPYPTVRFEVPACVDGEEPVSLRLEVTSVDGSGGTYGVRLMENPPARSDEGTVAGADRTLPPPTGLVEGVPLAFHAHPGDFVLLYVPRSHRYNSHPIQRREPDGTWRQLPHEAVGVFGERASMRTPEKQALVWFRPFRPGTYRFVEARPRDALLKVYAAEEIPAVPALVGTGLDPRVSAHGGMKWRPIGLGVCIPGMDYLFVAVGRRKASVGMRVVEVGEGAKALRSKKGIEPTRAPGLGPSYRFRVTEPTLVRLEVRGRSWIGHAMLGRAAD